MLDNPRFGVHDPSDHCVLVQPPRDARFAVRPEGRPTAVDAERDAEWLGEDNPEGAPEGGLACVPGDVLDQSLADGRGAGGAARTDTDVKKLVPVSFLIAGVWHLECAASYPPAVDAGAGRCGSHVSSVGEVAGMDDALSSERDIRHVVTLAVGTVTGMNLDALICPTHGWLRHFGIHEAGHAVAAIVLGFEFLELSIMPGEDLVRSMMLREAAVGAGVVMPTDQPSEWVGPRPDDALTMLLAGSLAEVEVLKHFLPGGHAGDVVMWRRGAGRIQAPPDELKPLLLAGVARATELARQNRALIARVYELVLDRLPSDGRGGHLGFDEPLILTYAEVRAVVLDAS